MRFDGRTAFGAAAILSGAAAGADAGGFKVQQGGPSLGNAGAGANATAEDASTVWFNPAGMTHLEHALGAMEANAIRLDVHWRDDGSTNALGRPLGGGDGEHSDQVHPIAALHAVIPVDERWRVGFSVNTPFGLVTDYGDSWVGRYHATRTELSSIDVGLSAAWKWTDSLSLGAGIDVQEVSADEESEIDFGIIGYGLLGPAAAEARGLSPGKDDGHVKLSADDIGLGWNTGVLWDAGDRTRVGVTFRSAVAHKLEGRARFHVPDDAQSLLASGMFRNTNASADLTLPEVASLGAAHRLDEKWTLLAGVDWTRWGRFSKLVVDYDNPAQADTEEEERWSDVWRVSLGATWRPDPGVALRVGVAYDQSPVDDRYRTPRLPDADRVWAAVGAGLRLSANTVLDVSFVHEFVAQADVRQSSSSQGNLNGTIQSSVDYVSVQLTIGF